MTELGLYLHVPFCRCKCDWCAFVSQEGTGGTELWLRHAIQQLQDPPTEGSRWATVYLGGGTPSLLTPRQLADLLCAVAPRLLPGAEITMEANPESLLAEHLSVLGQFSGTRLSLGIQSFQQNLVSRHRRLTTTADVERARRLIQDWSGSFSLDLLCGLEGQTAAGQRRDLEQALSWQPDHLSFYSLSVEPGTPLQRRTDQRRATLPGSEVVARWWLEGRDRIEEAGLLAYEVANFALPGAECRHNGRYWALEPWWGVGPSAVSFLYDKQGRATYQTQSPEFSSWLAGELPELEVLSPLELAKDRLLAGLRRREGLPDEPWLRWIEHTVDKHRESFEIENGRLFLAREAFRLLDTLLRQAFAELDERPELR